jgi:hypothetical protein
MPIIILNQNPNYSEEAARDSSHQSIDLCSGAFIPTRYENDIWYVTCGSSSIELWNCFLVYISIVVGNKYIDERGVLWWLPNTLVLLSGEKFSLSELESSNSEDNR